MTITEPAPTLLPLDPLLRRASAMWRPATPDHVVNEPHPERKLAEALGVNRETVRRFVARGGIPEEIADRWACDLGVHPANLWPVEWEALIR